MRERNRKKRTPRKGGKQRVGDRKARGRRGGRTMKSGGENQMIKKLIGTRGDQELVVQRLRVGKGGN